MNHHELRRRLNRAEVTAAAINARLGLVLSAMRDAQVDRMRAVSYDGSAVAGSTPDPTAEAAMLADRANVEQREFERQIRAAATALGIAARIASTYLPLGANATEMLRSLADERSAEPGCQSCATVGVWSPVHRTGDVDGRLPKPTSLCRACYRFVGVNDRAPAVPELDAWKRTGKLRPFVAVGR